MEKKKLKLTISGNPRRNFKNINFNKVQGKSSKIIPKKNQKFKSSSQKNYRKMDINQKSNFIPKESLFGKPPIVNDFEKRKLAEQRARKRLKDENSSKGKIGSKKRELKLTISRALSDEDIEYKGRSLASLKRARQKENKELKKKENFEDLKPVKREINIPEVITIRELANRMAEQSSNLIKHLLSMGVTATINHSINSDIAEYLVQEFGHTPIKEEKVEEKIKKIKELKSKNLKSRPPVVTIMGHVDHGKTSVLDVLRKTNVVSGEFGGITQHIGAYQISYNNNNITFIDTPGHAAFTEMRARGSKLTDLVILVVAADDGVKPQTVESIKHAKAANVPIVVAINKCDLPDADPQKIKNQLLEHELIAEELSGDTLMVEISTKTKKNLDKLLESVLLQSELLDLKTDYDLKANGIVMESKIDVGRGPILSLIITSGTLKKGDYFVSGLKWGKVRALIDDKGTSLEFANPSTPVEVLGINGAAKAGDDFLVLNNEKEAKSLCKARVEENKDIKNPLIFVTQDSAFKDKTSESLNLIIKSDVHGSSEAIKSAISNINHDEVKPKIILSDIGMITETDISLAKASKAVLVAFNVKPSKEAKKAAEMEKIKINTFNIIYELLDFIKIKMSGLLTPDIKEDIVGSAEILEIFKVSKVGKVAGSKVLDGEILQDSSARIIRDGSIIFSGKIGSIFREKNQTKKVSAGLECGITIKNFNDFKKKDIIEAFNSTVTERTIQ